MQRKTNKIKLHIRKGDTVKILAGNYRNKTGKVLAVFPKKYSATVEGIKTIVRHIKPSAKNAQGRIEKKEAPMHISNLMLIDPATGDATRIGRKRNEQGKLERYSKKSGEVIKND